VPACFQKSCLFYQNFKGDDISRSRPIWTL